MNSFKDSSLSEMILIGYVRLLFTLLFEEYASTEQKEQAESYERYCELRAQKLSGKYSGVDWNYILKQYRSRPAENIPIIAIADETAIALWSSRFPKSAYRAKIEIIERLYPIFAEMEYMPIYLRKDDSFQGSFSEDTENIDKMLKECGFKGIDGLKCFGDYREQNMI